MKPILYFLKRNKTSFYICILFFACTIQAHSQLIWTKKTDIPERIYYAQALTVGDKIYLVGGSQKGLIYIYDPVLNTWDRKPSFTKSRVECKGIGCFNNLIYSIIQYNDYDLIVSYDPANEVWTRIDSTKEQVVDAGIAFLNNKIYFIGGFYIDQSNVLHNKNDVLIFDLETKTWSNSAPLPTKVHEPVIAVSEKKIYAFCGINDINFKSQPMLQVYDSETDTWGKKSLNASLGYDIAAVIDSNIYIYSLFYLYKYEESKQAYSRIKALAGVGKILVASAVWNEKIYFFGGIDMDQNPNVVYNSAYELSVNATTDLKTTGTSDFIVWPNPAIDAIRFNTSYENQNKLSYFIYANDGKLMKSGFSEADGEINISTLKKGPYCLSLKSGTRISHSTFIKK